MTKEQELSPNMTDKKLEEIFAVLPNDMTEAELCAMTLTIHSTFLKGPAEIIPALIHTIYTYGMAAGMSVKSISDGLRATADSIDDGTEIKNIH